MKDWICFRNDGLIDLDLIRVMGVSVKEKENPIGYFGTGLKYAIAVLLRTGHHVVLSRGDEQFAFQLKSQKIRGQEEYRVWMNSEPLGFTAGLGRNWEPWQAYRELASNALDENGEVFVGNGFRTPDGTTCIAVQGEGIEKAYALRREIILESEPESVTPCGNLEVHPGATKTIYYRGVAAGEFPEAASKTYNITGRMELSEDRMFKSQWDVEYLMGTLLPTLPDAGTCFDILQAQSCFDANLTFSYCGAPSQAFIEAAGRFESDATVNDSIIEVLEKHRQKRGTFPEVPLESLSKKENWTLLDAIGICRDDLGASLSVKDVVVCETLGVSIHGLYHRDKDQIYLAKPALDMGVTYVAAVLYEEWVHKVHKLRDNSREMQSFLLHKLVSLASGENGS